jgi:putative Mg2+ transporter-C (MgtC) family protein
MPSYETLAGFWTHAALSTNVLVVFNLFGALILGLMVGYERSYHGRAAGMRTYGLVCMASCALTVIAGYPEHWFGAHAAIVSGVDPTRVIQGIVTGIGFLGAGVIMREGYNISGLTTAASIWAASAIGILVGVGFYVAAMMLALLSATCMVWISKLEGWLPSRHAVAILLRFKKDFIPRHEALLRLALERGYEIANGSFAIAFEDGRREWRFVAVALSKASGAPMSELATELSQFEGLESFSLSHARN